MILSSKGTQVSDVVIEIQWRKRNLIMLLRWVRYMGGLRVSITIREDISAYLTLATLGCINDNSKVDKIPPLVIWECTSMISMCLL